ncbi:M56 family metallopeptidase [Streptococcus macacae]|uniref:Peptidase, M56 family n=1 Tax=Streptococcus macacae NCTC 11558 TaxID=764298 RepID=G5JV07_9STRE|nr:M56 family metallopeptidase [Streptococcus macacae]EHJ51657.1 peptidase, M56 family [Streptococcus macacae NCTC 11558]SUN79305.1 putative membrane-associated Zn-dependent protease [Streptococcus macacae NCTC 11558]
MIISIFLSLVTTSITISFLMVLFAFISRAFPRLMSSRTRYSIWILILLCLLLPIRPLLGNVFFTLTLPRITQHTTAINTVAASVTKASQADKSLPAAQMLLYAFFLLWLLGSLLFLIRHAVQYFKLRRLIQRTGQKITDRQILQRFEDLMDCMQIKNKQIQLIRCAFIKSPMLTGLRRPVILLPNQEFSDQQMEIVLEHELTHYQHRDLFINLLMILTASLHWFNPIIRFANRVIQEEGEILCDESVLRGKNLNYRRFYGKTILSLIENGEPKSIALSTCFFESKMNLQHRLIAILDIHNPMKRLSYLTLMASIFIILFSNSVFAFATSIEKDPVPHRTAQHHKIVNKKQDTTSSSHSSKPQNTKNKQTPPATSNASTAAAPPPRSEAPQPTAPPATNPATGAVTNPSYKSNPSKEADDENEADEQEDNNDD